MKTLHRAGVLLALLLAACAPVGSRSSATAPVAPTAASGASASAKPTFATPSDASMVDGGCGATPIWKGSIPPGLEAAACNNAPHGLPLTIGQPPTLAGFLFAYPLRAGHPENPSNKVLWVVASDRVGPMVVDGHPLGATTPSIHYSFPDNSGPGNIYPSGIDVPTAGCWHFILTWSGHTAAVDLDYR